MKVTLYTLGPPEGLLNGPLRISDHGSGKLFRYQHSIGSIGLVRIAFKNDTNSHLVSEISHKAGLSPANSHPEKTQIDVTNGLDPSMGQ